MDYRVRNNRLDVTIRPTAAEDWLHLQFDEAGVRTSEGSWYCETDGGVVESGSFRIVRAKPPMTLWPAWWRSSQLPPPR